MTEASNAKTYAIFSAQKNKKLIGDLESRGDRIFRLPVPEIENLYSDINFDENVGQILKDIKEFEWIIFADVFASDFFLKILENLDFDVFQLDEIKICSLGTAAADRLRFAQIHTDIIPQKITTEIIINSIEDYIGDGENSFAGKKILVVREFREKLEFVEELLERKAQIYELPIYRARFVRAEDLPKIKALIKGGAVDEIVFNSSEEFFYFRFLFRNEDLKKVLSGINISTVNEITFTNGE